MTFILETENALVDALYCCAKEVTRGRPCHQRYGRGIIMGMRSMWLAFGYNLSVCDTMLRNLLPKDADPACFPDHFPGVYKGGRFKVHEHFNGYSIEDTKTGQTHWLSDGVDCVAYDDCNEYVSPGTPGFEEMWADDFNGNESETLEAYFSEQFKMEAEGKVACCDCDVVFNEADAEFHNDRNGRPEAYCPACAAAARGDDPEQGGPT